MGTTRFKGENASERLDFSGISDSDMIQLRHKPGTVEDADKGISKANLCSCPFGVSDTLAASAAKAAALTDSNPDFTLVSGREVVVCFTTANTASSPSLNFAGSGSIPIYYPDGSAVGDWPAGTWMHLKYFSASIGGSTIQRWILLSPLPVDTVAANNMHSVTSNAVYQSQKWFYTIISIGSSGMYPIALPSGIQNYECLVFETQRHITYRGIHIAGTGDVSIGCHASQYGALDNSQVVMGDNIIAFGAETVRGNVIIYYRPINLELIN